MSFDPIQWHYVSQAMKDPETRNAGSGIALIIYIGGGLLLFGPFLAIIISAFWEQILGFLGFLAFLFVVFLIREILSDPARPKK